MPGAPWSVTCSVHSVPDQYRCSCLKNGSANHPGAVPEADESGRRARGPVRRPGRGTRPVAGGERAPRAPDPGMSTAPAALGRHHAEHDMATNTTNATHDPWP